MLKFTNGQKKTWQSNPEIWQAIKEKGIFGQVVVKNIENDEFLTRLKIIDPVLREVWKVKWGGMVMKKCAEKMKADTQDVLESLESTFNMNQAEGKETQKNLKNAIDSVAKKNPLAVHK